EPRHKRVAFLEEVVRQLGLVNVSVHRATASEAVQAWGAGHALATARALAAPEQALQMLQPLVAPGGSAVVFLGEHSRLPAGAEEWEKGLAIVRVR
ncbi:MAG: RsmG family class I SAM-dependent methyltransferase, partial [Actinomycetota bacterium]